MARGNYRDNGDDEDDPPRGRSFGTGCIVLLAIHLGGVCTLGVTGRGFVALFVALSIICSFVTWLTRQNL
jgi:MFS-type transporter involved in bile tolerance (Atg22 family)